MKRRWTPCRNTREPRRVKRGGSIRSMECRMVRPAWRSLASAMRRPWRLRPAADLYQALASAAVMDADRDGAPLQLTEQVTLTLASGAVLEGRGDPAAGVLQLGGYHFYHSDFSVLLKGA